MSGFETGVLIIAILLMIVLISFRLIKKGADERDQLKIVGALSNDYSDVFLMDPVHDVTSSIKVHDRIIKTGKRVKRSYTEVWKDYISRHVLEDDSEYLLERINPKSINQHFAVSDEFVIEYRVVHNNEIHYIQAKFVKLSGESDKLIAGFRNIDKQIEAENKRRETLESALDSAEKASRAKTVFLTNISHDIRTPMNAIIGFASLALMHPKEPELVSEYLSKILVSGEHLMNLINDVLDMSRIESGNVKTEPSAVFLPDVIKEVETIVQASADSEKINFSVNYDAINDKVVYCDKLHLYQILINILGNAVKFTESGGSVSLTVSQKPYDDRKNGEYEFRIKDNGIGMSSEFTEHIFEVFSREKTSTVSGIQGTGLGMAITKTFVDMMGGTIDVFSEQGKGTEFVVVFHFRILDPSAVKSSESGKNEFIEDGMIREVFNGKSVLIVEDNKVNQEIVEEVLKEAGFATDIANDGTEAVDKISNSVPGQYDLVLMDIQMPEMDGYEAARIIRKMTDSSKSEIPIIAMTANAFDEDRRKAFEAGMNAHLVKPIRIPEFLNTVSKFAWKK